jgi:hypothetical protein
VTISIKEYYQAFKSVKGFLIAGSVLCPVLSKFLPGTSVAAYLCPPLGDSQDVIMVATSLALALLTYLVFRYCQTSKRIGWSPAVFVLGFSILLFVILSLSFVKHVWFGSVGKEVSVSVGFERTALAKVHFTDKDSDLELLHRSGTDEDIIEKLWTLRSIILVRSLLWLSYVTLLGTFVWLMSSMAYQHVVDETPDAHRKS